jgi:hypothetical protein
LIAASCLNEKYLNNNEEFTNLKNFKNVLNNNNDQKEHNELFLNLAFEHQSFENNFDFDK